MTTEPAALPWYKFGIGEMMADLRPQSYWKPIDTAPKDGRWVLVGWFGEKRVSMMLRFDGKGWIGEDGAPSFMKTEPTHWCPPIT